VEIEHHWPSSLGCLSAWCEHAQWYLWTFCRASLDDDILRLSDLEEWTATGDQDPACPGGFNGLEMNLLLADDISIVEGDIFGIEEIFNRGMERVRRLRARD
jgi:hypothetical protein